MVLILHHWVWLIYTKNFVGTNLQRRNWGIPEVSYCAYIHAFIHTYIQNIQKKLCTHKMLRFFILVKDWNVDLVPKFIMACGKLVKILLHSKVFSQYFTKRFKTWLYAYVVSKCTFQSYLCLYGCMHAYVIGDTLSGIQIN